MAWPLCAHIQVTRHQQYSLAGTNELPIYDQSSAALDECFVNLNEDYVPADNEFLVPLKSDPSLRQLPPDANAASNIYDMGVLLSKNFEVKIKPKRCAYMKSIKVKSP